MKNEFREHYTPAPTGSDDPHPLAVLAGAALTAAGMYLIVIVLFAL